MPEVSPSSSRSGSISQGFAATSETKASGPTPEAQVAEGQLQVRAEIVSDNIPPPEQAVPPTSSQAASQAATSGETKVRRGLAPSAATLALPGSTYDRTQSAFDIESFRARSPSSRSRMLNHPSMGSPLTERFPNSNSAGETKHSAPVSFDEWDTVETKQPPSRESASTASAVSTVSPSGSPLSRSTSSLGSPGGYGSGHSSPSMSPVQKLVPPAGNPVLARSASAADMGSGRASKTGAVKNFLTRTLIRSPPKPQQSDYANMDAVLASPQATNKLRSFLRRGREHLPPEALTEHLDFLQGYRACHAEANPVEKRRMFVALITDFVLEGSPREINLIHAVRNNVGTEWNVWNQQGQIPVNLLAALQTAKEATDKLMKSHGNPLDLLTKELFPPT